MSQVTEPRVGQRMRIAGLVASGVAAVLFVQDLFNSASFILVAYEQWRLTEMDFGWVWQSVFNGILVLVVFAVGVGVSLWRIAPVESGLAPTMVVLRGLLATAVGSALVFVVFLGFGLVEPLAGTGSLFGNSFPDLPWEGIGQAMSSAFHSASSVFMQRAPVVLLVVLLVWIWLARQPSRHAVSDDTAEV